MTASPEPDDASFAEQVAELAGDERARLRADFSDDEWRLLGGAWRMTARPAQLAPPGNWRLWLMLAGRGFGKTRSGAEWVDALARAHNRWRIALVGATLHDVRSVMIEGQSGILNLGGAARPPIWQPSLHKLIWPTTGTIATCYSAAEPEGLRGPEHHAAWADEIGRWGLDGDGAGALAAWQNMQLGLRLGKLPRALATTTPRATPLVRQLWTKRARTTVVSGGPTRANALHMPDAWLAAMEADYGGTRIGRQELDGEYIDELPGALFSRALFDRGRMLRAEVAEGALVRVVIGVDPPAGGAGGAGGGDACGIVACGLLGDGTALVLEDASMAAAAPDVWAAAVARVAVRWRAERVIAEANNGGAMVMSVLRAAGEALPVRLVHASRGKAARAEPLLIHYERGRIRHVGALAALEDELCGLVSGGAYAGPGRSPDRADACVWALTELLRGGGAPGPGVRML